MSTTTNLAIPYIQAGQTQKEVTHSTGMALLDAAITEVLTVSVASGNGAPTAAQYRACARIAITGASSAGRTVTLPAVKRPIFVSLDSASTKAVSVVRGSASYTILPGCTLYLYTDGTANGLVRLGEFGPQRTKHWVRGVLDNNEIIFRLRVEEASVLLPDLLGWDIRSDVAATGSTVLDVRKNGSGVGTATTAGAGTVATLATTGNAAVSLAAGDILDLRGPATADATYADILISALIVRS
jgi:hypothetical protein